MRAAIPPEVAAWTIFTALMVERWITTRFLAALLSEIDIWERPGYGVERFLIKYCMRYIESAGRLYRQRIGAAGVVDFHEEIGGVL